MISMHIPRILFDGRALCQVDGAGVVHHARQLFQHLALNPNFEWHFVGARENTPAPNAHVTPIDLPISDLIFSEKALNFCADYVNADLMYSVYYPLPIRRKCRAIQTICDLTPLKCPQYFPENVVHFFKNIAKTNAQHCDAIVTNSEGVKRDVIEWYAIDPSKITVIPLGLKKQKKIPQARPIDAPYLLSIGTLLPHKNIVRLIQAFDIVKQTVPDLKLVIVGKHEWGCEAAVKAIHNARHRDDIVLKGYVDNIRPYLQHTAALCYVSLYEGFGFPALEAMQAGVPVLASHIPSLEEIGADMIHYCDPNSVASIAAGIVTTLHDSGAQKLRAAQRRASTFTWQRASEQTVALCQRVLQ